MKSINEEEVADKIDELTDMVRSVRVSAVNKLNDDELALMNNAIKGFDKLRLEIGGGL